MGFLSALIGSFKKSKNLKRLQVRISPPDQNIKNITSNFMDSLQSGHNDRDEAIEEYLDLCINDEGVKKVMVKYDLSRDDLKKVYINS